jgi:hypothetical protein
MKQVKHTEDFQIDQPVEDLFPLFSAEGEKRWVPGWDFKNIMGYNELHENYVFVTKNHDHALSEAVWLVKKYDPDSHYVEFYKVEPGYKIGIITVKCNAISKSKTNVSVTYEYIALSEAGNDFIAGFTDLKYKEFIGEWKQLLENYFNAQH